MKNSEFIVKMTSNFFFIILLCCFAFISVEAQTIQGKDKSDDFPVNQAKCEEWLLKIDTALEESLKNKDASLIVIARLGSGETQRINTKRIKTLKEYILKPKYKVKAVFAEGELVKDLGIIEFYVEGKLFDSVALSKNQDIPIRLCY